MKLVFGKVYKDPEYGQMNIKVNAQDFAVNDDGTLEYMHGSCGNDFSDETSHMSYDELNIMVNNIYKTHLTFSVRKKNVKETIISPSHWYLTLSVEKKEELCARVSNSVEELVNDAILQNPKSKLNDYYRTLVHRSLYGKINFPELSTKDLSKLPSYNSLTDKLAGSPVQYLKLLAVIFPSTRRRQKFSRTF